MPDPRHRRLRLCQAWRWTAQCHRVRLTGITGTGASPGFESESLPTREGVPVLAGAAVSGSKHSQGTGRREIRVVSHVQPEGEMTGGLAGKEA